MENLKNILQFGKTESLNFDNNSLFYKELGAITIFDLKNIKDNTIVDVTIVTNDIKKICNIVGKISNEFEIKNIIGKDEVLSKDIEKNSKVIKAPGTEYNEIR